jgi:CMP-2-keto-3-deoxyoctulosonic acid synthetase
MEINCRMHTTRKNQRPLATLSFNAVVLHGKEQGRAKAAKQEPSATGNRQIKHQARQTQSTCLPTTTTQHPMQWQTMAPSALSIGIPF